jgi:hypothetical protein
MVLSSNVVDYLIAKAVYSDTIAAGNKTGRPRFTSGIEFGSLSALVPTGNGLQIASSAAQKLSFWGETPIVQPTTGVAEAAFIENVGGTAVNVDSTFGGYTLQQVVQALQSIGLLA